MKNAFTFAYYIFFNSKLLAENISIIAKNISINKDDNTTIFENEVLVKTKIRLLKVNLQNMINLKAS